MAFDEFIARRFRELSPSNWDKFVGALNARFLVLEEQLGIQRKVTEAVLQRGLQVIEDELGPVIAEAQTAAGGITDLSRNLGLLFRAHSATGLAIGTGETVFIIAAGERDRFAAPLYVIAAVEGDADTWMAGQVTGWDVATGALTVSVTNTRGTGTFAAWEISVASVPPETPPAQTAEGVDIAPIAGLDAVEVQSALAELLGLIDALGVSDYIATLLPAVDPAAARGVLELPTHYQPLNDILTDLAANDTVPAPVGTRMLFRKTTAPTGWSKDTGADSNDAAIKIVSGDATDGGNTAFSTVFANRMIANSNLPVVSPWALIDAQHRHSVPASDAPSAGGVHGWDGTLSEVTYTGYSYSGVTLGANSGGGQAMDFRVKFAAMISATRDARV